MSNALVECRRLWYHGETSNGKCYIVSEKGQPQKLLPKSQVEYIKRHPKDANGKQECDVKIPEWLAIDRNFSFD